MCHLPFFPVLFFYWRRMGLGDAGLCDFDGDLDDLLDVIFRASLALLINDLEKQ
jgi:hypothetical protein